MTNVGASRHATGHAVEAAFAYRHDIAPLETSATQEGALIGSGDGTIRGEALNGTLRWSFYSGNCAYLLVRSGVDPGPGRHLCTVNPVGIITTSDGAEVWFEGRGYGLRGADPAAPHLWRMSWSVRFETTDERYAWLNDGFGQWEGIFDEAKGSARYAGYLPAA